MRRSWTNGLFAFLLCMLIAPAAQAQLNITVEEIGQFGSTPDNFTFFDDMAIVGTTLFTSGQDLLWYTIGEDGQVSEPTEFGPDLNWYQIATNGTHLFVSGFDPQITLFDVSNPQNPVEGATLDVNGLVLEMEARDSLIITIPEFSTENPTVEVINVGDPANPAKIADYTPSLGKAVYMDLPETGDVLYLTALSEAGDGVLDLVDLSDPTTPTRLDSISTAGHPTRVRVLGTTAFVGSLTPDQSGWFLETFDVSDPTNPTLMSSLDGEDGMLFDIRITPDSLVVVSFPMSGIRVYSFDGTGLTEEVFVEAPVTQAGIGFSTMRFYQPQGAGKTPSVFGLYYLLAFCDTNPDQTTGNFNDSSFYARLFEFLFGPIATETEEEAALPKAFALQGNYPNPFNPSTEIHFDLSEAAKVQLVVYDVMGREVARLVDGALPAGQHRATWDASGLPSGTYLYRLTAGPFSQTKALTLLK